MDEFANCLEKVNILKTMTLTKLRLKEIYAEDEIGCISEIAKVPKVCVSYCRPSYIMLPIFLNFLSKVFIPKNTFVLQIFNIFRRLAMSLFIEYCSDDIFNDLPPLYLKHKR